MTKNTTLFTLIAQLDGALSELYTAIAGQEAIATLISDACHPDHEPERDLKDSDRAGLFYAQEAMLSQVRAKSEEVEGWIRQFLDPSPCKGTP